MCKDYFNDCVEIKPDRRIVYTGADVPELSLCQGKSSLLEVENAIITKLLALLDGTGIDITLPASCTALTDIINGDSSLQNILSAYAEMLCTLNTSLSTLSGQVNAGVSFDTSCLTGLPSSPTRDQIVQAALNKICSMDTRLTAIEGDYVKGSQLNTLIAQYFASLSTSGVLIQEYTKMPKYVALEYYGPLSNFDSSGKGLASAGYDKVFLCNGANGTPDRRGRVGVGAIAGVPGPALDNDVDPSRPENAGTNYALKQKFGKNSVALAAEHNGPHTHVVNDPGHRHLTAAGWALHSDHDGAGSSLKDSSHDAVDFDLKTNDGLQTTTTGITINTSGTGEPHYNVQPSIAAYYIIYLP